MGNARQLAIAAENRSIDEGVARATAAREAELRPRTALEAMAARLSVTTSSLQKALMQTAFKGASEAEFVALVIVANSYDLNPLLREIYAFPKKGGGISAMVGFDGWIKIAERHPEFDGIEFVHIEDDNGNLKAIEGILYRKDRSHPTKKMVYLKEFKRNTDPWNNSPHHMLDVRCYCHTVRIGLGVSLGVEGEEAALDGGTLTAEPVPALPSRQSLAEELGDEIPAFDSDTGEIRDERGMTEVGEDVARELDAGDAEEGQGESANEMPDDKPVWWDKVVAIRAGMAGAKTVAALKPHAAAFDNIRVGLPDEVIEELDALLVERRKALSAEPGK